MVHVSSCDGAYPYDSTDGDFAHNAEETLKTEGGVCDVPTRCMLDGKGHSTAIIDTSNVKSCLRPNHGTNSSKSDDSTYRILIIPDPC